MADGDEHTDIDADTVEIDARRVIVNTGWTPRMAMWNTLGTVLSALEGLAALLLSALAIWLATH